MRLLLEKNNIHLGNIMRACQSVIEMISSTHSPTPTPSEGGMEIEENEEEGIRYVEHEPVKEGIGKGKITFEGNGTQQKVFEV